MWLLSLFIIATIERLVGRAFYCFLQFNIQLGSVQDLTPTGDIVLHQIFVSDSQLADECESGDIFAAVMHLGQLTVEVDDVRLETVGGSHLDEKEVMVVLLELLARGVL